VALPLDVFGLVVCFEAYLDAIRNTLQNPKGGRSVLALSALISMLKNRRYRERQVPVKAPLNKEAIKKRVPILRHNRVRVCHVFCGKKTHVLL
jgi:hypothetical protein